MQPVFGFRGQNLSAAENEQIIYRFDVETEILDALVVEEYQVYANPVIDSSGQYLLVESQDRDAVPVILRLHLDGGTLVSQVHHRGDTGSFTPSAPIISSDAHYAAWVSVPVDLQRPPFLTVSNLDNTVQAVIDLPVISTEMPSFKGRFSIDNRRLLLMGIEEGGAPIELEFPNPLLEY